MGKEFGKELARLRKEKDWTQSDLADKLKVSIKQVSRWEMGVSVPSIDILSSISKIFKVEITDLVDMIVPEKVVDFKETKTEPIVLIDLIFVALGIAMGIGVLVLNILGNFDVSKAITMLGIGLFSLSLYCLSKMNKRK